MIHTTFDRVFLEISAKDLGIMGSLLACLHSININLPRLHYNVSIVW